MSALPINCLALRVIPPAKITSMKVKRDFSESIFDPDFTSPSKKAKQTQETDAPIEWTRQQVKLLAYLKHQGKSWKYLTREIKVLICRELMGQFPGRKKEEIIKAYKMRDKLVLDIFTNEDVSPPNHNN